MHNGLEEQIKLEKEIVDTSCKTYNSRIERAKQSNSFGSTNIAGQIIVDLLDDFSDCIKNYVKNRPMTLCSLVIKRIDNVDTVAFLASKVILNSIWGDFSVQSVYKAIGQALEFEYKMQKYKSENLSYYKAIQEDLNKRNVKPNKKGTITSVIFEKKLNFHVEKWSMAEKLQAGIVLVNIFVRIFNLVELEDYYENNKHVKILVPTNELLEKAQNLKEKFEVMQPLFLPMVCPPKKWTSIFSGGYLTPYLRKNKLIKNNDREYLKNLSKIKMPLVYEAINHLQETEWQINKRVLEVVEQLWQMGIEAAGIPAKYDIETVKYPLPDNLDSKEARAILKKIKRENFEIHKKNIQNRSLRLLFSQILKIAIKFKDYEKIWFPHQMDFRGRLYPIPVLLNPQGSDLSKGLLRFAQGKCVDKSSVRWLKIHGANLWGYDKESYNDRVKWVEERHSEIQYYAQNPLENRGWMQADKPFQFLAFCFEYNDYLELGENFVTHLPVLLDGTCNGLQHYSALLKDETGGRSVNLVDSVKPNDIYSVVADNLKVKLSDIVNSEKSSNDAKKFAKCWLDLGINRKLTKRPVMVLPYGGTPLSCREYVAQYLTDNYSVKYLQKLFGIDKSPEECVFRISYELSKLLWKSIQETLNAAIVGMDYIKKVAKLVIKQKQYLQWVTPMGLPVMQAYKSRKRKEVKTELFGSILKTNINIELDSLDYKRQLNGICPNFIHSLDAACLMLYIVKCKRAGIKSFMTIHDCYGTLACDADKSSKFLREAFVEIYEHPILENFTKDILKRDNNLPELPQKGNLDIKNVLDSTYFFN